MWVAVEQVMQLPQFEFLGRWAFANAFPIQSLLNRKVLFWGFFSTIQHWAAQLRLHLFFLGKLKTSCVAPPWGTWFRTQRWLRVGKRRELKSPAPSRNRTRDLSIRVWCKTTTAHFFIELMNFEGVVSDGFFFDGQILDKIREWCVSFCLFKLVYSPGPLTIQSKIFLDR